MKKIFLIALAFIMALTVLAACTKPAETTPPASGDSGSSGGGSEVDANNLQAGVSLYYRRDEFYKDLENSFIMTGESEGVKVDVQDADTDPAKQAQQLEDFVTKKFNAVAFAPAAQDALIPVAQAADDKGVAVFIFDGYMDEDCVTGNVIFDFGQCGVDLGNVVINYANNNLADKDVIKVAIIDLPVSTQVGVPIIDNFKATIAANGGFEVVAQQDGKADRNVAMGVMENILTAQKDDIDIVIGNNYDATMGGLTAVESKGLTGKIVGFSPFWGEEGFKKLEENDPAFKGGISYSPLTLGAETVKAIKRHYTEGLAERDVMCPSMVLTNETIKDFDWREVVAMRSN